MGKLLSKKKKLEDFETMEFANVTENNISDIKYVLDSLDPDIARNGLKQLSVGSLREILESYTKHLNEVLASNEGSLKNYYASAQNTIEVLTKQLEKEDLSFEEKKYIIDKLVELQQMMGMQDVENKNFLINLAKAGAGAVAAVVGIAIVALGIKNQNDF